MILIAMIAALTQWDWTPPAPRAPIPPANTWDGVAGFEKIVADPDTGQITFPISRQPSDALARGCVFGLANVRCPAPDNAADFRRLTEGLPNSDDAVPALTAVDPDTRIDCVIEAPGADQRRCTFDEALHNNHADLRERAAELAESPIDPGNRFAWLDEQESADKPQAGMAALMTETAENPGASRSSRFRPIDVDAMEREAVAAASRPREPETPARAQSGCRQEEYRSADGTSSGFRFVCGSGDQRLLDDVMGRLNPN